jgi:hypothetical protein
MIKYFLAAFAALTLVAPVATLAQDVPSYSQQGPASNGGEENLHGRIASFDGAYTLTVRDERGFIDNVQLHQGTIINPTGLTLEPGMVVSILGYNSGPYLAANEIDTPYTFYGGVPWYAGHAWDYYGPTIGLAFFFGNAGWWHGGWFHGGYGWNGGVRVYNNFSYRNVYRTNYAVHGATFRGRNIVAPRSAGGYYGGRGPRPVAGPHNGGGEHSGGGGAHPGGGRPPR